MENFSANIFKRLYVSCWRGICFCKIASGLLIGTNGSHFWWYFGETCFKVSTLSTFSRDHNCFCTLSNKILSAVFFFWFKINQWFIGNILLQSGYFLFVCFFSSDCCNLISIVPGVFCVIRLCGDTSLGGLVIIWSHLVLWSCVPLLFFCCHFFLFCVHIKYTPSVHNYDIYVQRCDARCGNLGVSCHVHLLVLLCNQGKVSVMNIFLPCSFFRWNV